MSKIPKTNQNLGLSEKEKAALDEKLANKKISNTEAVRRVYNVKTTGNSASALASKVFNKPASLRYLEVHAEMARNNIVELANDREIKPETRLKANQDILDRTDGKATLKTVTESSVLTLNADFSGGVMPDEPEMVEAEMVRLVSDEAPAELS